MSAIGASAGYPALKFSTPGDRHWGTIQNVRDVQATDFKTKQPLRYPDGQPVLQTILTVEDKDGELKRIFVRAGAMRTACAQAVIAAGASDVEPGGLIEIVYIGDEPASNGGTRKAFKARYKVPAPDWKPTQTVVEPKAEPVTVAAAPSASNDFDPYDDEPPF